MFLFGPVPFSIDDPELPDELGVGRVELGQDRAGNFELAPRARSRAVRPM
ncbi:MAG: hypothetical protein M9951_17240 [Burkholderiaceae bacterium]|nr:hypothetical protein [Burkholderiaceae bacterium]